MNQVVHPHPVSRRRFFDRPAVHGALAIGANLMLLIVFAPLEVVMGLLSAASLWHSSKHEIEAPTTYRLAAGFCLSLALIAGFMTLFLLAGDGSVAAL